MLPISLIVSTASIGIVYAVLALAVVFIYRTSRVLLFCVGEIGMLSAYVLRDVWVWVGPGLGGFAAGAAAAIAAAAVVGLILYTVIERFGGHHNHFVGTIVTVAFSIFLLGVLSAGWGGEISRLPIRLGFTTVLGQRVPLLGPAVIAVGVVVLATVGLALSWSDFGIDSQALADNRRLAQLRGIPVERRLQAIWISAAVMSGIGGCLSAAVSSVSIEGAVVGLSGIVAAIIGGLTSPLGAIIGAILLALGENVTTSLFDARYSHVVPVLFLVALLIVRPSGLSGRAESIARV